MKRPGALACLLACPLAVSIAAAAEAPRLTPERDVVVTYRTDGAGQAFEQRLRWSAEARRLRLEPPTAGMFVLIDYGARRMDVVREVDRSFLEMDAPASLPGLTPPASGRYSPGAEDRVAGLACKEWTMSTPGQPAELCITADGVLLRVRLGAQTVATASAVSYARQDPALFRVPDGYARVDRSR